MIRTTSRGTNWTVEIDINITGGSVDVGNGGNGGSSILYVCYQLLTTEPFGQQHSKSIRIDPTMMFMVSLQAKRIVIALKPKQAHIHVNTSCYE